MQARKNQPLNSFLKSIKKDLLVKKFLILNLTFLISSFGLRAQCLGAIENNNNLTTNPPPGAPTCNYQFNGTQKYKDFNTYIPTNLDPVITVKLVVHVFMSTSPGPSDWTSGTNQYNGLAALQNLFSGLQGNKERYSSTG